MAFAIPSLFLSSKGVILVYFHDASSAVIDISCWEKQYTLQLILRVENPFSMCSKNQNKQTT